MLVKSYMKPEYQNIAISLYTAPPKTVYKSTDQLINLNLGPACMFRISWNV